jgi:hypothetical protein
VTDAGKILNVWDVTRHTDSLQHLCSVEERPNKKSHQNFCMSMNRNKAIFVRKLLRILKICNITTAEMVLILKTKLMNY